MVISGDYKKNLLHIYAHMLEYAKNHKEFRLPVSEPKIGKVNLCHIKSHISTKTKNKAVVLEWFISLCSRTDKEGIW